MSNLIKNKKAFYVDRLPPCNNACPAGENIQLWLSLVIAERYYEAWKVIMQSNPMPAIHGRVCYHPCETACNRRQFDETVSIHAIERFLGDKAIAENWPLPERANAAKSRAARWRRVWQARLPSFRLPRGAARSRASSDRPARQSCGRGGRAYSFNGFAN